MVPLKYNVRNLRVRWVNTLLTVLATGLVVWSSCILFGLVEGLQHILNVSGDPLGVVVLRKGSTNETNGGFAVGQADDVCNLSGLARDAEGRPLVAKEMVDIPIAERNEGTRANLIVRGVSAGSPGLRPDFKVVPGGRYFEPGKGECIVSKSLSGRFKNATLGSLLKFGDRPGYRVVGLFTAGGSAAESEVWVDLKDMERNLNRSGYVSSVRLRAASPADRDAIRKTLENDTQFLLAAIPEADYYAAQSRSGVLFKAAGTMIAVLLTFGAMFAAANTMFAAVRARTREIGTMRALGFSRFDILISFLGESLLLCTLGGLLGLLATLPLSALTFSTNLNFSEAAIGFRFGPIVMGVALAMTLAMGVFGGLFPAVRAVRLDIVRALREV
jgi:putative ABC transport system permease protein